MAKKKVTECQKLIEEVDQEAREKLEKRFKEAYKDSKQILDKKTKWVEFCKERLVEANKELSNAEENLNELETADLDQWGKENPEPKEQSVVFYGGRSSGKNFFNGADYMRKAILEYKPYFHMTLTERTKNEIPTYYHHSTIYNKL